MTNLRTWRSITLTAIVVGCVLTACSGNSDDSDASNSTGSTPTSEQTASETAQPPLTSAPTTTATAPTSSSETAPPSSSSASTTQPPPSGDAARAKRAQIPAEELPGLNSEWVWSKASESAGPGAEPSECLRASMTAIGATAEYTTEFEAARPRSSTATATQITAVFPDQQTAATAAAVLQSWHDRCAKTLENAGYTNVKVSDIGAVTTSAGTGRHWLAMYQPVPHHARQAWFEANGFVTRDDTITYLVIKSAGQDYNYEQGQSPIELALPVAANHISKPS